MEEAKYIVQFLIWALGVLATLTIIAYGFIFKAQLNRIKALEIRPQCDRTDCDRRFGHLEAKQDRLEPILNNLEKTMSKVNTLLDILMADYEKRQK